MKLKIQNNKKVILISLIPVLIILLFSTTFAKTPTRRAAHQRNSHKKVLSSSRFDAIEVDLRTNTYKSKNFKIYHTYYHNYTLKTFLKDCKKSKQIAILDLKYAKHLKQLVSIVKSYGMIDQTIFQTSSGKVAKKICSYNSHSRCWLLNGAGTRTAVRMKELKKYKKYLEGINIYGKLLPKKKIKSTIKKIHKIKNHNKENMQVCFFAYGSRSDVYHRDKIYISAGADWLMTDKCPKKYRRKK